MIATSPALTGVPDTDKIRAANLEQLVFEQLNIATKIELDEP
jgi:hypothetical protein